MGHRRQAPSQTWRTFLRNTVPHALIAGQDSPIPRPVTAPVDGAPVVAIPEVGGLHQREGRLDPRAANVRIERRMEFWYAQPALTAEDARGGDLAAQPARRWRASDSAPDGVTAPANQVRANLLRPPATSMEVSREERHSEECYPAVTN
jgi:hypothetical protein